MFTTTLPKDRLSACALERGAKQNTSAKYTANAMWHCGLRTKKYIPCHRSWSLNRPCRKAFKSHIIIMQHYFTRITACYLFLVVPRAIRSLVGKRLPPLTRSTHSHTHLLHTSRPFWVAFVCTASALICVDGIRKIIISTRMPMLGSGACMHAHMLPQIYKRMHADVPFVGHSVKPKVTATSARHDRCSPTEYWWHSTEMMFSLWRIISRCQTKKTTTSTKDERNMNCIYLTFYENERACNLCEMFLGTCSQGRAIPIIFNFDAKICELKLLSVLMWALSSTWSHNTKTNMPSSASLVRAIVPFYFISFPHLGFFYSFISTFFLLIFCCCYYLPLYLVALCLQMRTNRYSMNAETVVGSLNAQSRSFFAIR